MRNASFTATLTAAVLFLALPAWAGEGLADDLFVLTSRPAAAVVVPDPIAPVGPALVYGPPVAPYAASYIADQAPSYAAPPAPYVSPSAYAEDFRSYPYASASAYAAPYGIGAAVFSAGLFGAGPYGTSYGYDYGGYGFGGDGFGGFAPGVGGFYGRRYGEWCAARFRCGDRGDRYRAAYRGYAGAWPQRPAHGGYARTVAYSRSMVERAGSGARYHAGGFSGGASLRSHVGGGGHRR